jgi:hypothetical protein
MWPRTDEERARQRNCGFCSFKRRADAEEARSAMHDYELDGHRMQVGWSKAVRINSAPFVLPVSKTSSAQALLPPQAPPPQIQAQIQVQVPAQPPVQVAGALTAAAAMPEQASAVSVSVSSGVMVDDVDGVPLSASGPNSSPTGSNIGTANTAAELLPPQAVPQAPSSSSRWDSTSHPTHPTTTTTLPIHPTLLRPVERDMEEDDEALLVAPPACPTQRRVVDLLAQFTATDGEAFERVSWSRYRGIVVS